MPIISHKKALLLAFLLVLIVSPVLAVDYSQAVNMGNVSVGSNFPLVSGTELCQAAGYSGAYGGWEHYVKISVQYDGSGELPYIEDFDVWGWATEPENVEILPAWNGWWIFEDATCDTGGSVVRDVYHVGATTYPPVANFACDNVYANPDTEISCFDLSTNSPDSWEFLIIDNESDQRYGGYTSGPWSFDLPDLGTYDAKLKVCNAAGCDWENKTSYLHIQMFPNWTATPTPVITSLPWTNISTLDLTAYRSNVTGGAIGNLTAPWLDFWDGLYGIVLPIFLTVEHFLSWPMDMLNDSVFGVSGIFDVTFNQLLPYATVPLSITGRVLISMPWWMKALITLGLLFDTMLLLLLGKG